VRITESQNKKIKEYAEKFDLTISAALREIVDFKKSISFTYFC